MADLSWRKGLSLTIKQAGDEPVNLIPNPRFAKSLFDGWSLGGSLAATHSTSSSPALPTGMTAKAILSTAAGTGTMRVGAFLNGDPDGNRSLIAVKAGETYAFGVWLHNPSGALLRMPVYWYDRNGNAVSQSNGSDIATATGVFTWYSQLCTAPAGAVMCQPAVWCLGGGSYSVHMTGAMLCLSPRILVSGDYKDGDSAGCGWEGQLHGSYSLRDAGRTWEIAREAQDVDFTTKMPGGFSKLSFVVSRPLWREHDDLKRDNTMKLALNGASLFEGFVHSVEPELGDNQRIRVTCHGPWARYGDDQTWRRVYRDTSLRAWKTDQNNDNAGLYYHDKADRLHIRIPKNVSAPAGSCRRLYYWLYDGIPEGDRITRIVFNSDISLGSGGSGWVADIMGRDDPDNQEGEFAVWSRDGGSGTGSQDIAITQQCRCLVLRLRRTGSEAAPTADRYVKLTDVAVFGTSVSDVRVDTVMADIAGELAPSVQVASEGSGYEVDHAAFRRFTSRARAIRRVAHYVDGEYDYAVWEDGVFYADDRPDGIGIPAAKTIVVQADRPGMAWKVRRDYDKAFDGVTVRYRKPEKGEGKQLTELTRPAGGYSRVRLLDYSRYHHMTTRMAAQIASRHLRRWQAGTERGEVTLTGDVVNKNGVSMPAISLRAGMWIENISLPGHRPLFVSKVRTNLDTGEVTLRINDGDRRHMKHRIKMMNRRQSGEPH